MTSIRSISRVRRGLLLALLATCRVVAAGADSPSKPSSAELAAITARGRMLAEYDAAAWQATDAVMATHPKTEPSGRYIGHRTDAVRYTNASVSRFFSIYPDNYRGFAHPEGPAVLERVLLSLGYTPALKRRILCTASQKIVADRTKKLFSQLSACD